MPLDYGCVSARGSALAATVVFMAVRAWWDGAPSETYWMEITDRSDLGGELWAPKSDAIGGEMWSYTLVSYVQPGDRVFHWHKNAAGEPALVGWSEAAGPLGSDVRAWQARGTAGRARGAATTGPVWVMPLKGLHKLPTPVSRSALNGQLYESVLDALQQTQEEVGQHRPAYAPFQHYGGRELRAQQGYLTKFPAALVAVLSLKPHRPRTPCEPTRPLVAAGARPTSATLNDVVPSKGTRWQLP